MPTLQLYSVAEVAQRLNLSERTIWRLIERRQLRETRIGARVTVSHDDLARFIVKRRGADAR